MIPTLPTLILSPSIKYPHLPWRGNDGLYCTDEVARELVDSQMAMKEVTQ